MNNILKKYKYIFIFSISFLLLSKLGSGQDKIDETKYRKYFEERSDSLNSIEGIWSVSSTQEFYRYDTLYNIDKYPQALKVAIINSGESFASFDLSGKPFDVSFHLTDVKGVYMYRNFFRSTNEYSKAQAVISTYGIMQYTYEFPEAFLKTQLGDSHEEGTRVVNLLTWKKIYPVEKAQE